MSNLPDTKLLSIRHQMKFNIIYGTIHIVPFFILSLDFSYFIGYTFVRYESDIFHFLRYQSTPDIWFIIIVSHSLTYSVRSMSLYLLVFKKGACTLTTPPLVCRRLPHDPKETIPFHTPKEWSLLFILSQSMIQECSKVSLSLLSFPFHSVFHVPNRFLIL